MINKEPKVHSPGKPEISPMAMRILMKSLVKKCLENFLCCQRSGLYLNLGVSLIIGLWKMWFWHAKSVQYLRKCHPFAHLCVNHEPRRLHIGPPETQDLRPLAMHTGAETRLASQTREQTPCTQTIDTCMPYLFRLTWILHKDWRKVPSQFQNGANLTHLSVW